MPVIKLKGRLGPWGDNEGEHFDLRTRYAEPGTQRHAEAVAQDLAEAVGREHLGGCSDPGCDIREAHEAGFPLVAAWLLASSTETDYTERLLRLYRIPGDARKVPGWDAWAAHHDAHALRCAACGAVTYDEDPTQEVWCCGCGEAVSERARQNEEAASWLSL